MADTIKQRNLTIDSMRALGLILIILAHTIPNNTLLFQIRNFDVPMMAVVSGMAFIISAPEKLNLRSYYWKRVLRLLIPTWVFLVLFFSISAIVFFLFGSTFPLSDKILGSFLLKMKGSFGFVWVIRVFLLTAMTAPLLLWIWRKVNLYIFAIILVLLQVIYELVLNSIPKQQTLWINELLRVYIYFAIPYTVIAGFGMILTKLDLLKRILSVIIMTIVLISVIYFQYKGNNIVFMPQHFKYPPHSYFVPWGITMSILMSILFHNIKLNNITTKAVSFLSSRSLWIYFWHIVVLYIIEWNYDVLNIDKSLFEFLLVLFLSIILTKLHDLVFGKLSNLSKKDFVKRFITDIFLK